MSSAAAVRLKSIGQSSPQRISRRTEINVLEFSYVWTIKNFSFCDAGERLKSPTFSHNETSKLKWCLCLYPVSENEKSKEYVSVFLELISSEEPEVRAKFAFSLLDDEQKKIKESKSINTKTGWYVFRPRFKGTPLGFHQFVQRNFLFNKANRALPDDTLSILAEITARGNEIHCYDHQFQVPGCTIFNDFVSILDCHKFGDVIMVAGDKEFSVYRGILIARSPVFAAMFEHEMQECNQIRTG